MVNRKKTQLSSFSIIILILLIIISLWIRKREKARDEIMKPVQSAIRDYVARSESDDLKSKYLGLTDSIKTIDDLISAFIIEMGMGKHGISTIGIEKNGNLFATSPQIGKIEKLITNKEVKKSAEKIFKLTESNIDSMQVFNGAFTETKEEYYKFYFKTNDGKIFIKEFHMFADDDFSNQIIEGFINIWSNMHE